MESQLSSDINYFLYRTIYTTPPSCLKLSVGFVEGSGTGGAVWAALGRAEDEGQIDGTAHGMGC